MTTSNLRPLRPSTWPLRSPVMRSISGNRSVWVLPRLKNVSVWPRSSASDVMCRPMKRVPPRMRIFNGFFAFFTFLPAAQEGARAASEPAAAIDSSVRRFMVFSWSSRLYLLRALLGTGRRVGGDPVAHGLVPEQRVLRLQHPVVLVREVHELRWHAALLQRVEQLDAVVHRHAQVHLVVDDQRRRLEVGRP